VTAELRTSASFEVEVPAENITAFAELSGDWNPLHTDADYAAKSEFGRPLLHGAFSAGLLSRLAGMYIPGTECLLTGMQLRFVAPIRPPVRLRVHGELKAAGAEYGRVEATVTDAETGARYVDGAYDFGRHRLHVGRAEPRAEASAVTLPDGAVLVTGAGGGLGQSVMQLLGSRGVAVSRTPRAGAIAVGDLERLDSILDGQRLSAVVHCGWPAPDNSRLVDLSSDSIAVEYNIAEPLRESIALARVLARFGRRDGLLVLVGSTAAMPGRHAYRAPLYTLGKTLVPDLARILAVELAPSGVRCAAVVFDVIETGMNANLSPRARLAHVDRSPAGRIPTADEAAAQIGWLLDNPNFLVSGGTITLSGGALP
jgi:acyl dehydratase/NAD(P)-dependent dehydrogenase (short-subunit alcohol dehydrogenase family)